MNLRDNLNSYENYIEIINKNNGFIEKRFVKIEQLLADEREGRKRYPKENSEIILSTYQSIFDYQLKVIQATYSSGQELSVISTIYDDALTCMENGFSEQYSYSRVLEMLSLGILLEKRTLHFKRLEKILDEEQLEDRLLNILLKQKLDNTSDRNFIFENPYKGVSDIIVSAKNDLLCVKNVKLFMENWYRSIDIKTHKSNFNIHSGYWCWEAGALVKVLGIDDSNLHQEQFYPYDLVHAKI